MGQDYKAKKAQSRFKHGGGSCGGSGDVGVGGGDNITE